MAEGDETELTYEEKRKQRVEENKKKMGELGLLELEKRVSENNSGVISRKSAKRKMPSLEEQGLEARRSSRVAAKPAVIYNEAPVLPGLRGKIETRHGLAKQYTSDKSRMAAIDAAEEVLKELRNPAFIKPLLHSHTSGGFWMGLQSAFCKEYLPADDDRIMLEANDLEWECIYLAGKGGLSGGWRGFSIDNRLTDGDCCIFELVNPRRFMVHIFRVSRDVSLKSVTMKGKSIKKAGKR